MNTAISIVRAFNHRCPWHQHKYSLAKRVERSLPMDAGLQIYDGILGDLRMRLDLANYFERWIYLNVYDVVTVKLLKRLLKPGDVYVDAGANVGLFVLVAARCVGPAGRVIAFEPSPTPLSRLRDNVALNGFDQVQIIPNGVWSEAGEATLYDFDASGFNEGSMGQRPDKDVAGSVTIQTVRMDDVVDASPAVVKIDVEGAEQQAMQGARRMLFEPPYPHVLLELNRKTCVPFGYEPIDLVDALLERGANDRLRLLKSKRIVGTSRDQLASLIREAPTKLRNVWFEPRR